MDALTILVTIVYTILSYGAAGIFIYGFLSKIWQYFNAPSPLKIPTTPAPTTGIGAAFRVAGEVLFFSSLFKGNKWTWIGGYAFHAAFLVVILRHFRYFLNPIPEPIALIQPLGIYAGLVLPATAAYLFIRRLIVDRTRYISSIVEDYLLLILIISIALSGLLLKFVTRPDLINIKAYMLSLMLFRPTTIPLDPVFLIHLSLVLILLVYFPYSKLMHAGGIFFSPSRNQADNPREKRLVAPWAAEPKENK